jgi:small subunit ribosomal protein S8
MINDPIADMLVRLQNGSRAGHARVDMPGSRVRGAIADVLKAEGYIKSFKWLEAPPVRGTTPRKTLRVYLKFTGKRQPVIQKMVRVSRSGRRRYRAAGKIPRILRGMGTTIMSTPQGIMSDKAARKAGIGGEVLCYVM